MKVGASDQARRSSGRLEGGSPWAFGLFGGGAVYAVGAEAGQIDAGADAVGGER